MPNPKIFINVQMDEANRKRLEAEEHSWTGPKLIGLAAATLGVALIVLWFAASSTSETYWDRWLVPGGIDHELEYENLE